MDIQTGFRAKAHCWKCFKPTDEEYFLDGRQILLCKGCQYDVKTFSNWLNAYGLGIRAIPISEEEAALANPSGAIALEAPARVEAKNGKEKAEVIPEATPTP